MGCQIPLYCWVWSAICWTCSNGSLTCRAPRSLGQGAEQQPGVSVFILLKTEIFSFVYMQSIITAWQGSWSYFSQITPGWQRLMQWVKGRYRNEVDAFLITLIPYYYGFFYWGIITAGWFCFAFVGIFFKVLTDNCLLLTSTHCVPPGAWHVSVEAVYSCWKCGTFRKKVSNSSFPFCQAPGCGCAGLCSGGRGPGLREVWTGWDMSQGRFSLLFVTLLAHCQPLF